MEAGKELGGRVDLTRAVVIGEGGPAFEARPIDSRYRTLPYRPDTVVDGWAGDGFVVRAASLRGLLHRYNGAPRQDDVALARFPGSDTAPERLVVAVADGVSSAPQSHLGATVAVRFAVQWLSERLAAGRSAATLDWPTLFRHAAWQLVEQARLLFPDRRDPSGGDGPDPALAAAQLATTLLCGVVEFDPAEPAAIAHVAGLGDSAAWLICDGDFAPVFGGKARDGGSIASSAVAGLPLVPTELAAVAVAVPPGAVLLLGTDGFGDPLGSGAGDVGRTFLSSLAASPPPPLHFAHLLDFSRETFDDDRTLVAVWPKERAV
jgi:hypothetical protein